EQITGKQPITHKTDLYALGCVLFEMLTGRTPYHGESQAEMLFQHVQGEIPRISEFVDDCPEPLEELVRQLLEKDPDKRPHDAAFVLYRLNEVKNQIESAIRADTDHKAVKTIEDVHPELTKIIDQKKASPKKKKKKRRKRKEGPFYEQTWFLASCLVLLIGVIAWSLWPPSEKELFLEAQKLMETDDPVQWQEAKERYLEPLLERYPDGEYAQRSKEYLDKIAMHLAKRRAITDARLGREPKTEAERHFIDAWRFEQFGDRVTAIEKYRSLIELFKDRPEDRAYVALARQQIASIEAAGDQEDNRVEIINQALERADKLFEEGKVLEARKIWNSIITLYASNLEFEPQVKRARARLSGRDEETAEKSPVPGKEAAPEAQKEPR
ncbi:MAG: protein kinase, partial [Planctomycetes bacterium]|nr:protein kinase [Planctomycetota bacterium]